MLLHTGSVYYMKHLPPWPHPTYGARARHWNPPRTVKVIAMTIRLKYRSTLTNTYCRMRTKPSGMYQLFVATNTIHNTVTS